MRSFRRSVERRGGRGLLTNVMPGHMETWDDSNIALAYARRSRSRTLRSVRGSSPRIRRAAMTSRSTGGRNHLFTLFIGMAHSTGSVASSATARLSSASTYAPRRSSWASGASHVVFARDTRHITGLASTPIAWCPMSCAATSVVPLPQNGSSTTARSSSACSFTFRAASSGSKPWV